ncbi:MAG: DUF177 domain-containing protein [Candidatus Omnitrophica bacterium]|nr:DUF177 domain-containing protein [Candidatus Omnitrophota bacterium]MCF7894137.1 DUF177 domain-containing protein [Candidatus Omnitrophota bacterium]
MKIAVKKITEEGLSLDEKVPVESWNLDGFDLKFIDCIKIQGEFKKIYNEIISKIGIKTHCQIRCSRCLTEVCQVRSYSFEKSYSLDELNNFLNIDQDIREEILLNFPLKVLCSSRCQGLCPRCGRNLNWGRCNCLN